jgi:hypothetical protein
VPLTLYLTAALAPVFPSHVNPLGIGVSGFPFAYSDHVGASSNSNIISVAPLLIDLSIVGAVLHVIGLGLRAFVSRLVLLPVAILLPLLVWPQVAFIILWIWTGNRGFNWFVLGPV